MKHNKHPQQKNVDRAHPPTRPFRRSIAVPLSGIALLSTAILAKEYPGSTKHDATQDQTAQVRQVFEQDLQEAENGDSHLVATNQTVSLRDGLVGHPFILSVGRGKNKDTQYVAIDTKKTPIASSTPK